MFWPAVPGFRVPVPPLFYILLLFRLSNHLQLFSRFCALPWKDVFAVSTDILDKVKNSDPDFYNHLKEALSQKISPVDVYDFAYEILHKDTKKSAKLWQELYKKKKKDWKDRDLAPFGDPTLYIRKWLSECFTGILGGTCNIIFKKK